jgi:hypothetical protein
LLGAWVAIAPIASAQGPTTTIEPTVVPDSAKTTELSQEQPQNLDQDGAAPSADFTNRGSQGEGHQDGVTVDGDLLPALAQRQVPPGQNPVTSVDELSDIEPGIWYYDAIVNLVEKYQCVAGYPDGTFRPQRSISRAEMAVLLNNCLEAVAINQEDIETIKALQEEFAAELATLRGRVDGLEAQVKTLEAQQFSTNTKLSVSAATLFQFGDTDGSFQLSSDNDDDGVADQTDLGDARASAIAAVYMSFNTSFSGNDLLQTTLFFGNGGQDTFTNAEVGSTPTLPFSDNAPLFNPGQNYFAGVGTTALLYRLAYTFKPFEDLSITAAPLFYPTDIIDSNSYTSPFTGFSTWFFVNNPLITPYITNFLGGAGGGFTWNPGGGPFTARAAYVAVNGFSAVNTPPTNGGLFGDPYQVTGELEFADDLGSNGNFAVRLQYTNSATNNVRQDVIGFNGELTLGKFGVFGRYGFSFANGNGVVNPLPFSEGPLGLDTVGEFEAQTFQAGVAINDLLIPGSQLAAAVGAPFLVNDSDFPNTGPGVNDDTQLNIEAFYRFPINDNITLSPIFSAIINPNNSSAEPNIYQGLLRAVFSF